MDEYDLSFQRFGRGSQEDDWDTTGEDGRYEVQLYPGRYDVRNDEEGACVTSVVISAGQRAVVLDIDLPRQD